MFVVVPFELLCTNTRIDHDLFQWFRTVLFDPFLLTKMGQKEPSPLIQCLDIVWTDCSKVKHGGGFSFSLAPKRETPSD